MKRRAFFARLAGAVAATAVAPSVLANQSSEVVNHASFPVRFAQSWDDVATTFTVGDTFTIQGHYAINAPNTLQTYTIASVVSAG